MAKPITFKMKQHSTHKGSVRFNGAEDAPLQSAYVMRDALKEAGVKKLDDIQEIEVTIRVSDSKKKSKEEEDDEDDE